MSALQVYFNHLSLFSGKSSFGIIVLITQSSHTAEVKGADLSNGTYRSANPPIQPPQTFIPKNDRHAMKHALV